MSSRFDNITYEQYIQAQATLVNMKTAKMLEVWVGKTVTTEKTMDEIENYCYNIIAYFKYQARTKTEQHD
jgi:hypothetical protein